MPRKNPISIIAGAHVRSTVTLISALAPLSGANR